MKEDGTNLNEKGRKEIKLATELKAKKTYCNLKHKTKQVEKLKKEKSQLIMMVEKGKTKGNVVLLIKFVTLIK